MSRTRTLSYVIWSTMAATGAAACGDDGGSTHLPDAPVTGGPTAMYAPDLAFSTTCGDAATATADLSIKNTGTSALVISAANVTAGFTVTTALPLTIQAGATKTLTVQPPAAVIGTDLAGQTKTGSLTLTTNEANPSSAPINLAVAVHGANLAFTDQDANPLTLAFTSNSTCPAPQAVFLRNTGDAPLMVSNASASGFTFSGFSGGMLDAGAFGMQTVRPFQLTGSCSTTELISYSVSGANVCTSPTATITATFNMTGTSSCYCS